MNLQRTNIYVSTLLFILMIVGYQLVTTVFLPADTSTELVDTQSVTVPFRALMLFICLFLFIMNFRYSVGKFPINLKLYWFFWIILILRIFYDTNIRTDIHVNDTSLLWMYIFGIILPLILIFPKVFVYIDLSRSLVFIFALASATLLITLFNTQLAYVEDANEIRYDANIALNTISYGHLGTTVVILGLYMLKQCGLNNYSKLLILIFCLLGIYSILRAGSRGPFVTLFGVIIFWCFSRMKNVFTNLIILILGLFFLSYFLDDFLELIGYFSPIMEERLKMSVYEGDTSGRNPLYAAAIEYFLESPIWGKQFAIFKPIGLFEGNGGFVYSHNIILDAFMGLGIIGGVCLIYILYECIKIVFYNIRYMSENYWVGLLLLQSIIANMFSGAIYFEPTLSGLLVLNILLYNNVRKDCVNL